MASAHLEEAERFDWLTAMFCRRPDAVSVFDHSAGYSATYLDAQHAAVLAAGDAGFYRDEFAVGRHDATGQHASGAAGSDVIVAIDPFCSVCLRELVSWRRLRCGVARFDRVGPDRHAVFRCCAAALSSYADTEGPMLQHSLKRWSAH